MHVFFRWSILQKLDRIARGFMCADCRPCRREDAHPTDSNSNLKIYIDYNNAFYRTGKSVVGVCNLLFAYAAVGFIAVLVYNGTHPTSKQANAKRCADCEKKGIEAYQLRLEIQAMQREMNKDNYTLQEYTDGEKKIAKLTAQMKKKETQSQNAVPSNFVE